MADTTAPTFALNWRVMQDVPSADGNNTPDQITAAASVVCVPDQRVIVSGSGELLLPAEYVYTVNSAGLLVGPDGTTAPRLEAGVGWTVTAQVAGVHHGQTTGITLQGWISPARALGGTAVALADVWGIATGDPADWYPKAPSADDATVTLGNLPATVTVTQDASVTAASGTASIVDGTFNLGLRLPPATAGAVLLVPSGTNVDTLQADGEYKVRSDGNLTGLPIWPTTGRLSVTSHSAGLAQQTYWSWQDKSPNVWIRSCQNSVWGPWVSLLGNSPLSITRSGNNLSILSQVGALPLIVNAVMVDPGRNNGFNIESCSYAGAVVHSGTNGDELAPVRVKLNPSGYPQTVGGNHALDGIVATFTNADGKDATDLGSVYTDGARDYVVLDVTSAKVTLLGSVTTDANGASQTLPVAPAAALTNKSGGTHKGTIDHATKTTVSITGWRINESVTVFADGQPISGDVARNAITCEVREVYSVPDVGGVYAAAVANPGKGWRTVPVKGCIRVTSRYKWSGGGRCTITIDMDETAPCTVGAMSGIQSVAMVRPGYALTRYLPGVGTVNGHTWATGQNMGTITWTGAGDMITTAHLLDPKTPPPFALDVLTDSAASAGFSKLGYAFGYRPNAGASTDSAARLAKAPTGLFDMRSFKKLYPQFTTGAAPGWGRYTVDGYRQYLDAAQADALVSTIQRTGGDAMSAWAVLSGRAAL